MARQGRARAAALAALMAITLVVPSVAVRADLLGGVTDWADNTVDDTTDATTDLVDTTEDIVDNTIGDTGTGLDETVESLTDTVDTVSDELTRAVDETTGDVLTDPTTTTTTTIPTTTTTTVPRSTTTTTTATTTTTIPLSGADTSPASDEDEAGAGIADDNSSSGGSGLDGEALTVLSVAGGLTDPSILEPVRFVALPDESLYGRLLDWLVGAGSGLLGLLAGPLLALEILLRALLSAGSGLVAPASLLVSYLGRLLWESRARGRYPATA